MSQSHYVKQLPTIELPYQHAPPETPVTPHQLAQYQSLLGAVAWLNQTRVDIAVYTQALQRATHKCTLGHISKLNKLVRWLRRKTCNLVFHTLQKPRKVLVVSDAAFRREDPTCLAMGVPHRSRRAT